MKGKYIVTDRQGYVENTQWSPEKNPAIPLLIMETETTMKKRNNHNASTNDKTTKDYDMKKRKQETGNCRVRHAAVAAIAAIALAAAETGLAAPGVGGVAGVLAKTAATRVVAGQVAKRGASSAGKAAIKICTKVLPKVIVSAGAAIGMVKIGHAAELAADNFTSPSLESGARAEFIRDIGDAAIEKVRGGDSALLGRMISATTESAPTTQIARVLLDVGVAAVIGLLLYGVARLAFSHWQRRGAATERRASDGAALADACDPTGNFPCAAGDKEPGNGPSTTCATR